jgi:anti-sigma regulatory factor (Ser/Thr protein kinase)
MRREAGGGSRPLGDPSAAAPTASCSEPTRCVMQHTKDSQRLMRTEARAFFTGAGIPARRVEDVMLVLTELVTNGCEAGGIAVPVSTILSVNEMITIEVVNRRAADSPDITLQGTTVMPDMDAERGRGLALVSVLSARLSIETTPLFTVVRADMLR